MSVSEANHPKIESKPPRTGRFVYPLTMLLVAVGLGVLPYFSVVSGAQLLPWYLGAMAIGTGAFVYLENPSSDRRSWCRLGWGLLVIAILLSAMGLLFWSPWFTAISIGVCIIAATLIWMEPESRPRGFLLAALVVLPVLTVSRNWTSFHEYSNVMTAKFTVSLLDGWVVSNERIGTLITTPNGSFDVASKSTGVFGMELVALAALLYFFARQSSLVASSVVAILLWVAWISLRSAGWAVHGYGMEYGGISDSMANYCWMIAITLGFLAIPLFEYFVSTLLAIVPDDAVASEFPFFVDLYNVVVSFPNPLDFEEDSVFEPIAVEESLSHA